MSLEFNRFQFNHSEAGGDATDNNDEESAISQDGVDNTERKIENYEIKNLEEPISNILNEMRPNLEKGEYSLIIGDDTSGRVPALVFKDVLSMIYSEKNIEKPKILFIPGQKESETDMTPAIENYIREYIQKSALNLDNKKALIVTDLISSGYSIYHLVKALQKIGIPYDISTIGFSSGKPRFEERLGSKIYHGEYSTPDIYTRRTLSGVDKKPDMLKAKGIIANWNNENKSLKHSYIESIKSARKDVDVISQKIFRTYKARE